MCLKQEVTQTSPSPSLNAGEWSRWCGRALLEGRSLRKRHKETRGGGKVETWEQNQRKEKSGGRGRGAAPGASAAFETSDRDTKQERWGGGQ